jgi:hypothetical protein
MISSLAYSQNCEKITKKVDDFEDKISFRFSGLRNVSLSTYIEKGEVTSYLSLHTTGSTLSIGEKGVYILLDDGQKIIKANENIDSEFEPEHYYGSDNYEYSAFISLTKDELDLLTKHSIKKFKLYIYEQSVSQVNQDEQKELTKCLIQLTDNAKK